MTYTLVVLFFGVAQPFRVTGFLDYDVCEYNRMVYVQANSPWRLIQTIGCEQVKKA